MHPDDADSSERGRWSWSRIRQALGGRAPGASAPSADPAGVPSATALYERGLAAERARRSEEAIAFFRAAIAEKSDDAEFHYALAAALKQAGRADEAVDSYRAGLLLQPGHARMRVDLGLALRTLERPEEALA